MAIHNHESRSLESTGVGPTSVYLTSALSQKIAHFDPLSFQAPLENPANRRKTLY